MSGDLWWLLFCWKTRDTSLKTTQARTWRISDPDWLTNHVALHVIWYECDLLLSNLQQKLRARSMVCNSVLWRKLVSVRALWNRVVRGMSDRVLSGFWTVDYFPYIHALQSSSNAWSLTSDPGYHGLKWAVQCWLVTFYPAYWLQRSGYVASLVLDLRQALERLEAAPNMCTKVW